MPNAVQAPQHAQAQRHLQLTRACIMAHQQQAVRPAYVYNTTDDQPLANKVYYTSPRNPTIRYDLHPLMDACLLCTHKGKTLNLADTSLIQ
jgi:hypothetical protein